MRALCEDLLSATLARNLRENQFGNDNRHDALVQTLYVCVCVSRIWQCCENGGNTAEIGEV